jgi:hypothetical protein
MISLSIALGLGFQEVGKKLVEVAVDPMLEPAKEQWKKTVQKGYRDVESDEDLNSAIQNALNEIGAPRDEDSLVKWLQDVCLDRLVAKNNPALRRQFASAVIYWDGANNELLDKLAVAVGWPRSRKEQLVNLVSAIRRQLYTLEKWRPLIQYTNDLAKRGMLVEIIHRLDAFECGFLETDDGRVLKTVLIQQGMTESEATKVEHRYRQDLSRELRMHDFRGIIQTHRDIRLPLADIYLELGLIRLHDRDDHERRIEIQISQSEAERIQSDEKLIEVPLSDVMPNTQRLVILGEPGSGKTISLKFITLMLALGYGYSRLGLNLPFVPLMLRLADYARALKQFPALTLDNYILMHIKQAYLSHPRLDDFFRFALDKGACIILLDGLDEVGDDDLLGQTSRMQIAQRVQQFSDRWCSDESLNRLIVTSRLEGYWDASLNGFEHTELSRLSLPDGAREFLLRWYSAHEQAVDKNLPNEIAEKRARNQVELILPKLLETTSIRRLAENPLLLTILALIQENVGRLPNQRVRLYEICTQTMIESWRQAQTGVFDGLISELGEDAIIRIMAPLAYWFHCNYPGGTATYDEWYSELMRILINQEGYQSDIAQGIADRFMNHARYWAGLLTERGLGKIGFFHLTFEEYLAAREIARQRAEKRRELLRAHWEDPRWREVILLSAGQLGIIEAKMDDLSDYVLDLLQMEVRDQNNDGKQVVLAGKALEDAGIRSVTSHTRRWVIESLVDTMQDRDPETKEINTFPKIAHKIRHECSEALDRLGWLPEDLNAWVYCTDSHYSLMVMKYPVTNSQYERFITAGGYENPSYWKGEMSNAWKWRQSPPEWRGDVPLKEPEYWLHPRLGKEQRGYPVVGISFYEAQAYASWLNEMLSQKRREPNFISEDLILVQDLIDTPAYTVCLPKEQEWVWLSGCTNADPDRFPWDPSNGPATMDPAIIISRCHTRDSEIRDTSSVAIYPLGASKPFGIWGLAGNVYEYTNTWVGELEKKVVVRGGSWYFGSDYSRCNSSNAYTINDSYPSLSFRLIARLDPKQDPDGIRK